MIEIASIVLSALATLLVTICGWFVNRVIKEHDTTRDKCLVMDVQLDEISKKYHKLVDAVIKNADDADRSDKDLDIRLQLAENRRAVMDTKLDNQASSLEALNEALVDIRENMVRRVDLDALVAQINRRKTR